MIYLFYLFVFIIGTCIGSFLNSIIFRLKTKESLIKKRSHCPYCKKTLSWLELIPIVSFILQKGRCRHCKKPISLQYPLVELTTGVLFVLVIFNFSALGGPAVSWQFLISLIFWLFVVSCLVIIFVYDLKHYIIPDEIIRPALVVAFLYWLQFSITNFQFSINFQLPIFNHLLAGLGGGLFFLVIVLFSQGRWMGMGDTKLVLFMGLILGWPKILIALFLAFLSGALISIALIAFKKKNLKSQIPFGPFLSGATIIAIFLGDALANWYFSFFGF